jgi:GLPGLI family protein
MIQKIKLLFFLFPIYCLAQEKVISENTLYAEYTYTIQMKGAPSALVINSMLTANQYTTLYEMDFLGNSNFQKEEDSEEGVVLYIKPKHNKFVYKDFEERAIYSIERVEMKPFLVKDSLSFFNWKIENEFKDVIGYKCQKATTFYRGRNYEAYFTTAIPYQTGPWKFCNLPGLILEVYSTDDVFKIEANKLVIKNTAAEIENPFQKNIEKAISWRAFTTEYKKKYNELLHYRGPGGVRMSIPKKGIETYIE